MRLIVSSLLSFLALVQLALAVGTPERDAHPFHEHDYVGYGNWELPESPSHWPTLTDADHHLIDEVVYSRTHPQHDSQGHAGWYQNQETYNHVPYYVDPQQYLSNQPYPLHPSQHAQEPPQYLEHQLAGTNPDYSQHYSSNPVFYPSENEMIPQRGMEQHHEEMQGDASDDGTGSSQSSRNASRRRKSKGKSSSTSMDEVESDKASSGGEKQATGKLWPDLSIDSLVRTEIVKRLQKVWNKSYTTTITRLKIHYDPSLSKLLCSPFDEEFQKAADIMLERSNIAKKKTLFSSTHRPKFQRSKYTFYRGQSTKDNADEHGGHEG